MRPNAHERACRLIVSGQDASTTSERQWLYKHLAECDDCQRYARAIDQMASALRRPSQPTSIALLEQTTRRVRRGAQGWRARRQHATMRRRSSLTVALFLIVTLRLSWMALAYLATRFGYSHAAIQASFTYFWLIPSIAAGVAIVIVSAQLSEPHRIVMEPRQ